MRDIRLKLIQAHFPIVSDLGSVKCECGVFWSFYHGELSDDPRTAWAKHFKEVALEGK